MSERAPAVRVVVLNWNSEWYTRRCLRALRRTEYPADRLELVLVDNGSVDGSLELLRAELDGVRVVANGANLGFAEGCNRAMRDLAGVDAVALVNNDTVVDPGWLWPLVRALQVDRRVGAASARLVLEPAFVPVRLRSAGPEAPVELVRVRLDGLDVTAGVRSDGAELVHDPRWPLRTGRRIAGGATLWVPAGDGPGELVLEAAGDLDVQVAGGEVSVVAPGVVRVSWPGPRPPGAVELLNGLGTALTPLGEGYDRELGRPDAEVPGGPGVVEVDGFCGGGALLRSSMLAEVGWFDPRFFAYYEDTDLSWRARRRGWRMVAVPDSVIHHAHGGSGGFGGGGFFFLDRRNWLLTVHRNGDAAQRAAVVREARRLAVHAARANVASPLKHARRPHWELVRAWAGVGLAAAGASRRVARGRDRRVGVDPTDRVRSRLQPVAGPPVPRHRPGGPRLVYLDVSDTLRSGWRAGIQRVVRGLVAGLPRGDQRLELVPVVWSDAFGRHRRATAAEVAAVLAPTATGGPAPPGPTAGPVRRAAVGALEAAGLRDPAAEAREALRRRSVPADERSLLLDRLEPGAVFLDADAVWNHGGAPRAELLPALAARGVHVVPFVHDLLPVERPEWFVPELVREFTATVDAQLRHAAWVVANSSATAASARAHAARLGRADLDVVPLHLGVDPPAAVAPAPLPGPLVGAAYLLVVGTVEPRKNQALAVDVLERLVDGGADVHLAVVGRPGWHTEELAARLRGHPLAGRRLHWFDDADDAVLDALYRHATLVLVPSLTEGYGLPVLESLSRGTPVVSSTGGGLGEVGGDAVERADPDDPDRWVALVRRHLDDPGHHAARRSAVAAQEPRTWDATAVELADEVVRRHGTP